MTRETILVMMLPAARAAATADNHQPWWRIIDGRIVEHGSSLDWIDARSNGRLPEDITRLVAIAPGGDVSVQRPELPALPVKQRDAVAVRVITAEHPASAAGLNIVPVHEDAPQGAESGAYAVASTAAMDAWTAWCSLRGLRPDVILPAILLAPIPDELGYFRLRLAGQSLLRGPLLAFAEEPGLSEAIVGQLPVVDLPGETVDAALAHAAQHPPANLATGRWAARGDSPFTPQFVKRAAILALALLLLTIAVPIASWAKLTLSTRARDADSIAAAEGLLNPVPAVEAIPAALDIRLASLGGDSAKVTPALAALLQAMEPQATASLDQVSYQEGGSLSVTLGAPRAEDINAILLPLQASGWKITAQGRSGADGRSLADITIRNGK